MRSGAGGAAPRSGLMSDNPNLTVPLDVLRRCKEVVDFCTDEYGYPEWCELQADLAALIDGSGVSE